jgi:DNA-directed RNA polymerase specialized sigma24 family protein
MAAPQSTCWTIIQAAAAGNLGDREEFARRYLPVVRAYLAARWRQSALMRELDDAVQEVFVECFRPEGPLQRAASGQVPGFRAFLFGVVRNVARRFEASPHRNLSPSPEEIHLSQVEAEETSLERLFDRAWAEALLVEAARRQQARAAQTSAAAVQRVELLRLRFEEDLPIRDIAARWNVDPAKLHHEYALARKEFKAALLEVVAFYHPGSPAEVEQEAAGLLRALS